MDHTGATLLALSAVGLGAAAATVVGTAAGALLARRTLRQLGPAEIALNAILFTVGGTWYVIVLTGAPVPAWAGPAAGITLAVALAVHIWRGIALIRRTDRQRRTLEQELADQPCGQRDPHNRHRPGQTSHFCPGVPGRAVEFAGPHAYTSLRCYGGASGNCGRVLIYDSPPGHYRVADQATAALHALGWRQIEVHTGGRWGSSREWHCPDHATPGTGQPGPGTSTGTAL